jgi:tetratricopeptide (TPR) repeat protein
MKQLQGGLTKNPAMLFNLAKCAESEGRLDDATRLLTDYVQAAPMAADGDEVKARLVVLKGLSSLPAPKGALVRTLYTSAGKHVDARAYDQAIADYQKADEAIPEFAESKRRIATLLEAQGQVERARAYYRQVIVADTIEDNRQATQIIVDSLGAEKAQYDEFVGAARQLLNDLIGRSLLEGEPVGRIYAAYQLQLANEKLRSAALLLPLASEGNLLQAFTCSQMNDFRCVRAGFDALRIISHDQGDYGRALTGPQANRALHFGWRITIEAAVDEGGVWTQLDYPGAPRRYAVNLLRRDGRDVAFLPVEVTPALQGPEWPIEGPAGARHKLVLAMTPASGYADLWVDGVKRISSYPGMDNYRYRRGFEIGTGRYASQLGTGRFWVARLEIG